ncbi:beta strand repeat-containing protein [Aeoliella sp. SH292]|uniref:beta strand repeat-containing protein n=1 Tax=Aeoliella sp. SH292 TaxID=3454464 RepID=UPI003F9E8995
MAIALDRTWIGGNVDWVDAGSSANWTPADEPDSDDTAIFNTSNSVSLGSNNAVNGLTLSGGIDLFTNEFDLAVDGLVQLSGASTFLTVNEAAGSVTADDVLINSGSFLELAGGELVMDEEVGSALIDLNVGGTLQGTGIITFADNPGVASLLLVNDGTLTALSRPAIIFSPPPVGTLTISDVGVNGRIDLDGTGEAGIVNVNRNQSLITEIPLFDTFNGTLNLFHNSTFQFDSTFTLGTGGSIAVNNGFVDGGLFDDTLADISYIDSAQLSQSGGTINVADTDGTLQIDAAFTMSGGTFTNSGTAIFNGVTSITTASGYSPASLNAQTIVNANFTINDGTTNFNWDGNGAADTTVNNGSLLSITAMQIDTGDNTFGGDITLNDASDLTVNVTGTTWTLAGALHKNDAGVSVVSGDRIVIAGAVNVNEGTLDMPAVTTSASAAIDVVGTLTLGSASEFAGGDIDGMGLLRMEGTSTVTADTVISVDTFDWDGLGTGTTHTINSGVTFAVSTLTMDSDGDMDDPITLAGADSALLVNALSEWTMTAAINSNNAGVGTALIGGASRMILSGAGAVFNVNGDTNVGGAITYGPASTTSIDAGFTLDSVGAPTPIYAGGTITGAGTYSPGSTNSVTANSTISVASFAFDGGTWTIEPGAMLTVNVTDYDTVGVNSFTNTITLNNGDISVTTGDAEFIMNGVLNMNSSEPGEITLWTGEPLDIGNDVGAVDADLNVTGTQQSQIGAPVDFNSDADVDIAAGATLSLLASADFNTVNGLNNAQFTGAGRINFSGVVNVNEAVTFDMVGGQVDLDGLDSVGDLVNVDAPLTINAKTLADFGRLNGGGGVNTLDINNSVGTGVLTVNLDDPSAKWTLNGPGQMNLVNDNTDATLLAGSDVNINGTLNVTGDVRTTARLDIAGNVNINTAGQPLRLSGGDNMSDFNTIVGGTISGAGILGADDGKALVGFGTINTSIDFDAASNLFADNGTLTIAGAIVDVARIGTNDVDGVLNVVNAWNTVVASFVTLEGGTIQGGTMTIDNGNGVSGEGLVASRVINNTRLRASGGVLVAQTAGNDNDWDGAAGAGVLAAINVGTLELRDVGAAFGFTGTVEASTGSRVFANGFALDFNPGSTLDLTGATYEATSSTDIGGTVTIGSGVASTIKVQNNFFLTFETGSATTLDGNLQLQNNNINIEAGATFSGAGALVIDEPSHAVLDNGSTVNVLLVNEGAIRPGNSEGIGTATVKDYSQASTGELFVEVAGTLPNQFDRIQTSGVAQVDGYLNIDIDGGFVPVIGNTFDIISTVFGVSGSFDTIDSSGMPAGVAFAVSYLPNAVRLTAVAKPLFEADFDEDGDVDATDYVIWKGAFGLNQLGDANGDNITNIADYTVWRDQLGSGPMVGPGSLVGASQVPEPGAALLGIAAIVGLCGVVRRCPRVRFNSGPGRPSAA